MNAAVKDIYAKSNRRSVFLFTYLRLQIRIVVPQSRDISKWLRTCITDHYLDYHLKRNPKAKKKKKKRELATRSRSIRIVENVTTFIPKIGCYRNVVLDCFEQILK